MGAEEATLSETSKLTSKEKVMSSNPGRIYLCFFSTEIIGNWKFLIDDEWIIELSEQKWLNARAVTIMKRFQSKSCQARTVCETKKSEAFKRWPFFFLITERYFALFQLFPPKFSINFIIFLPFVFFSCVRRSLLLGLHSMRIPHFFAPNVWNNCSH